MVLLHYCDSLLSGMTVIAIMAVIAIRLKGKQRVLDRLSTVRYANVTHEGIPREEDVPEF